MNLFYVVSLLCVADIWGEEIVVPTDDQIAVVVADAGNIQILCERELASQTLTWTFTPHNSNTAQNVYSTDTAGQIEDTRWTISDAEDPPGLILSLTVDTVASAGDENTISIGTYTCSVTDGTSVDESGFRTLIEIEPITCDSSSTGAPGGDTVVFPCVVEKLSHLGDTDVAPTFVWTHANDATGAPGPGTESPADTFTLENTETMNSDFIANRPFVCTMAFSEEPLSDANRKECIAQNVDLIALVPSGVLAVEDNDPSTDPLEVTLPCSRTDSNHPLTWGFAVHNGDGIFIPIYDSGDEGVSLPGYKVDDESDVLQRPLTIEDLTATGAGTYRCSIATGETPDSGDVEVVLIDEITCSPDQSLVAPESSIDFSCTVTKLSHIEETNIAPTFTWLDGNGNILSGPATDDDSDGTSYTFEHTETADEDFFDNDQPFRCNVDVDDDLYLTNIQEPLTCDAISVGRLLPSLVPSGVLVVEDDSSGTDALSVTLPCNREDSDHRLTWGFAVHSGDGTTFTPIYDSGNPGVSLAGYQVDDESDVLQRPLTIEDLTPTGAGTYRCSIDTGGETPDSGDVEVVLINEITCSPEESLVAPESSIGFPCTVTKLSHIDETNIAPTFTWLDGNGNTLAGPAPDGDSDGTSYTFEHTETADEDFFDNDQPFRCNVDVDNDAYLTNIQEPLTCDAISVGRLLPSSTVPSGVLVVEDDSSGTDPLPVTLPCNRGDNTHPLTWGFAVHSSDGTTFTPIYDSEDPSVSLPGYQVDDASDVLQRPLTIQDLTATGAGTYRCSIDTGGTNPDSGDVEVVLINEITCSPDQSLVAPGSSISFPCTLTKLSHIDEANIAPTFTWLDGNGNTLSGPEPDDDSDGTSYTFEHTETADEDFFDNDQPFRCNVDVDDDAYLTNIQEPLTCDAISVGRLLPSSTNIGRIAASEVVLDCEREDTDQILTWQFTVHDAGADAEPVTFYSTDGDAEVEPIEGISVSETGEVSRPATIASLQADQAGTYSCIKGPTGAPVATDTYVVIHIGQPVCDVTPTEGGLTDNIDFSCTVQRISHAGNTDLLPFFSWESDSGTELVAPALGSLDPEEANNYEAADFADQVPDVLNDQPYTCNVAFMEDATEFVSCNTNDITLRGSIVPSDIWRFEGDTESGTLSCGMEADEEGATVSWHFTAYNEAGEVALDPTNNALYEEAADTENENLSVLTIESLTRFGDDANTAGTYRCSIAIDGGTSVTLGEATVAIYGEPICNRNEEGNLPVYECTVSATSDEVVWSTFEWQDEDGNDEESNLALNVDPDDDLITDRLEFAATTSTDTSQDYTCVATVGTGDNTDTRTCVVEGGSQLQFSLAVMLGALLLAFCRI